MARSTPTACTVRSVFYDSGSSRYVAVCEPRNPVEAMMASGPIVRGKKGETAKQLIARLEGRPKPGES